MYLSDSTLHSAIDGISRTLGIYVEVEGAEYAPASIIRLEWENECIEGSNFTIGGTLSNRIELEIYHDSRISVGDQIKPSVEIEVEGIMKRVPLGIFYVDDVVVNKEITTLTAYDAMISLNKEYIPSANHKTLKALASDVCQQAGIMMKGTVESISIKGSLSGYSYRETLGFIASFHAGNMVVDRDGQFKIKTYDRVNRTIPNHAYFSFDQKDTYRVSGVMCNFGDVGVGRGDDTAQCVTFENPYVTDAHMDAIYLKLKDLTFVAGTLKYRGDMNLDAGDLFTLTDANGQDHLLLCGQNQLTFTGGLTGTLISIGEGQGANQYVEYQFKNKKSLTQLTVELGSIQAKINEVENKLEGDFVTSEEMSSAIEMTKDEINLSVSSTYITHDELDETYQELVEDNNFILEQINTITGDDYISRLELNEFKNLYLQAKSQYNTLKWTIERMGAEVLNNTLIDLTQTWNNLTTLITPVLQGRISGASEVRTAFTNFITQYNLTYYEVNAYLKNELNAITATLQLQKDSIDFAITKSDNLETSVTNIGKHMSFSDNWLELYGTVNGSESQFKTRLSDTKLAFYDGGNEVASISNKKLHVENAEVKNTIKIGNIELRPSANGGMVFVYSD